MPGCLVEVLHGGTTRRLRRCQFHWRSSASQPIIAPLVSPRKLRRAQPADPDRCATHAITEKAGARRDPLSTTSHRAAADDAEYQHHQNAKRNRKEAQRCERQSRKPSLAPSASR
jgi:hypothetical protein